jgi:hypothetical protein
MVIHRSAKGLFGAFGVGPSIIEPSNYTEQESIMLDHVLWMEFLQ